MVADRAALNVEESGFRRNKPGKNPGDRQTDEAELDRLLAEIEVEPWTEEQADMQPFRRHRRYTRWRVRDLDKE
jgi:hypothetical protein